MSSCKINNHCNLLRFQQSCKHANPGFLMNLIFFALGCECSSQESGGWIFVQVLVLMACLCLASTSVLLLVSNSTKRIYIHTLLIPKTITFSVPVTNITPGPSKKHTCMCEAARPFACKAKPDLIVSHFLCSKTLPTQNNRFNQQNVYRYANEKY